MIPEFFRCLAEESLPVCSFQWRIRIPPRARPFKRIATGLDDAAQIAGLSRNTAGVLELIVIGFQLVISDGPILDGRMFRECLLTIAGKGPTANLEIPRSLAPRPT